MKPVSEGQQVASPTSQCTYVFKHLYVAWRYCCLQTCWNADRFFFKGAPGAGRASPVSPDCPPHNEAERKCGLVATSALVVLTSFNLGAAHLISDKKFRARSLMPSTSR